MDRVFLDANILFSAAYKPDSRLKVLWTLPNILLMSSDHPIEEAKRNLAMSRPNQLNTLEDFVSKLFKCDNAPPQMQLPPGIQLNERDRPVLLTSIAARATHLLTGDKDHFGRFFGKSIEGVLILKPASYIRSRDLPSAEGKP